MKIAFNALVLASINLRRSRMVSSIGLSEGIKIESNRGVTALEVITVDTLSSLPFFFF